MASTDPPSDSAPDDDRRTADYRWSDEPTPSERGGLRQRPERRPVTPRTDAFSYGDRLVIYELENTSAWITGAVSVSERGDVDD